MNYLVLTPETEKKLQEINRRIRRLQNGGCIDSLKNLGVNIQGQIGASYVSLKQLALQYEPDEKLAFALWNTRQREAQIVACFLFPVHINKEKITQLISGCMSTEIAEYIGAVLVSGHPELTEILKEWTESSEPFLQIAALCAGAKHLMLCKGKAAFTPEFFKTLVKKDYTDKYVQLVARRYR